MPVESVLSAIENR